MSIQHVLSIPLFAFMLLAGACATAIKDSGEASPNLPCYIAYNAGSSGTRLFIYQQTAAGWVTHRGPETVALADPVRAIRGQTMADATDVVGRVVNSLEGMRQDGPANKNGEPAWPAFDWRAQCDIQAAAVYATAGMRLAEELDPAASELLWQLLNDRLGSALGMEVTTRTISGFEEGLFAWLAIGEGRTDDNFGIAEMGGASVQITFPCDDCEGSRPVRAGAHSVALYSDSFLGLGQDEAWKKFQPLPACERGVGLRNARWQVTDCEAGMVLEADAVGGVAARVASKPGLHWYLGGAFRYMRDTDIEQFCRKGIDSGFEPETACFRAVYAQKVLSGLGLPDDAEQSAVDWTLGAVLCTATRCREAQ